MTSAPPAAKAISGPPAPQQIIEHDGTRYTTIREGLAHILVPEAKARLDASEKFNNGAGDQGVFYNPIQQFNRDLTVLAIKAFGAMRIAKKAVKNAAKRQRQGQRRDKKRKMDMNGEGVEGEKPPAKVQRILRNGEKDGEKEMDAERLETAPAQHEKAEPEATGAQLQTQAHAESPGQFTKHQPKFAILDAFSASGLRAIRYAREIPFVTSVTANDLEEKATKTIKLNARHNGLEDKITVTHDDAIAHMYSVLIHDLRSRKKRGVSVDSKKYDVVDLDPYGSAGEFLDAAVQAVRNDGGLLCITCTDAGVWASNGYPEKCYSLYGGVPVKGWYGHEAGLRLVLHAIEAAAGKYGLAIEPLLSLSIDFYCRVFVQVHKSPASVKMQAGRNMIVYNCDNGCGAWTTQPLVKNKPQPGGGGKKGSNKEISFKHGLAAGPTTDRHCEHCGMVMHLAGPMYGGRIHSADFIRAMLAETASASHDVYHTATRVEGMLQTALEELLPSARELERQDMRKKESVQVSGTEDGAENNTGTVGHKADGQVNHVQPAAVALPTAERQVRLASIDPTPFYFHCNGLAGVLHCKTPPDALLRGALVRLGYRVARSHCKPASIKTDAPWAVVWHVMREWVRQKAPIKKEAIRPKTAAWALLKGTGSAVGKVVEGKETEGEGEGEGEKEDGERKSGEGERFPELVFDKETARLGTMMKDNIKRYHMNPQENWGPMNRARGSDK